MFGFFKKKEVVPPKRKEILIPKDKVKEFIKLYNDYSSLSYVSYERKYALWSFIEEAIKEELDKFKTENPGLKLWASIKIEDICNPYIEITEKE